MSYLEKFIRTQDLDEIIKNSISRRHVFDVRLFAARVWASNQTFNFRWYEVPTRMHLAVLKGRSLRGLSVRQARLFSRWKHVGFMTRIHSRVLVEVVVHALVYACVCLSACSPSFLPTSRMVLTRRWLRSSFFDASVSERRGALSALCDSLSLFFFLFLF